MARRPLADVTGLAWLEEQAAGSNCCAERIRRALSEARLAAGEHRQLIGELEQMVTADPLDEHLHGQLMLALYRAGRQADALAVYDRMRQALATDLGIDPSHSLRDLHTAILRHDQSLAVSAPGPAAVAASSSGDTRGSGARPAAAGGAGLHRPRRRAGPARRPPPAPSAR